MSKRGLVHATFRCCSYDCNKEWSDYKTAQRNAAAHARRTGHTVRGEVAYAVTYYGRAK